MKKRILSVALAVMIIFLSGCNQKNNDVMFEYYPESLSTFTCVEKTEFWLVVYHNDTRVMYAVSFYGNSVGVFTQLVEADGSPLLWKGDELENEEK